MVVVLPSRACLFHDEALFKREAGQQSSGRPSYLATTSSKN